MLGSREALFAFAQTIARREPARRDRRHSESVLSDLRRRGAARRRAHPLRQRRCRRAASRTTGTSVPDDVWARTQLLYVCSPDNPTGRVLDRDEWQRAVRARPTATASRSPSDECYSEIYFDEAQPAARRARRRARGAVATAIRGSSSSAACRSARMRPGLRSGYVAGDAALIKPFLLYRTYHGSGDVAARSPRRASPPGTTRRTCARTGAEYAAKFARCSRGSRRCCRARCRRRRSTCGRARRSTTPSSRGACYAEENVTVLPGSFIARDAHGANPGRDRIRIALVADAGRVRRSGRADRRASRSRSTEAGARRLPPGARLRRRRRRLVADRAAARADAPRIAPHGIARAPSSTARRRSQRWRAASALAR